MIAVSHRDLNSVLCDGLEGWDARGCGRRLSREGIYVYLQRIHIVVQQKPIQHCNAIILLVEINLKKGQEELSRKKNGRGVARPGF